MRLTLALLVLAPCGSLALCAITALVVRRSIRHQITRLRQAVETITASEDHSGRVTRRPGGILAGTALDRLAAAVNDLLDTLTERAAGPIAPGPVGPGQPSAGGEPELAQRQQVERDVRQRAQAAIDDSSLKVIEELLLVVEQAQGLQDKVEIIDQRVAEADRQANEMVRKVEAADAVVAGLGDSLKQVAETTALISGVAEQTNLLALNATIEAARAGAAGAGFSVVAREVKNLAMTTARSTEQIKGTIESLERSATAVSDAILSIGSGIGNVDWATKQVGEVAAEQQRAVNDLNTSVNQAVDRIQEMTHLTEQLERRRHERAATASAGSIQAGGATYQAWAVDISEGGLRCRVDATVPLPVGTTTQVTVMVAGQELTIPARVVRRGTAEAPDDVGLKWISPSAEAQSSIRDHVSSLL